jgi:hypothetical protein
MRFVELRVGDRRVLRLIRGWLKAGVVEDGKRQPATKGTPRRAEGAPHARRAVISPPAFAGACVCWRISIFIIPMIYGRSSGEDAMRRAP